MIFKYGTGNMILAILRKTLTVSGYLSHHNMIPVSWYHTDKKIIWYWQYDTGNLEKKSDAGCLPVHEAAVTGDLPSGPPVTQGHLQEGCDDAGQRGVGCVMTQLRERRVDRVHLESKQGSLTEVEAQ